MRLDTTPCSVFLLFEGFFLGGKGHINELSGMLKSLLLKIVRVRSGGHTLFHPNLDKRGEPRDLV